MIWSFRSLITLPKMKKLSQKTWLVAEAALPPTLP
jgi:hypothetical protein